MQPTTLTNEDFGKLSGLTARGVTSTSGGRQEYGDSSGNTYYRNEQNVGTPQYSTNYEKIGAAPSSPVTIVTSGQSRTNYANNVNTLQTAQNNLRTVQAGDTASGIAAKLGQTPEEFLKNNPGFAGKGGKNDFGGLTGDIKPGQTYKIGPDGTPTEVKTGDATTNPDGSPKVGADGTSTNADGSTNPPGTTSVTDPKTGKTYAGIDPVLAKQYNNSLTALDQQVASAKQTLDDAKATLANDPAAMAAIDAIAAKYDVLIQQMKDKNAILIGSQKVNSARSGALQYANEMNSNFMSNEMDRATQRVADLVTQEQTMILKTQQAYKDGDLKALNEATKAYDDANKEKLDAITKLLDETDKAVKTQQAQAKIDAASAKQQVSDDIRLSTSLATGIADAVMASGITDEKQIDDYIENMAEKSGIVNTDILKSAVTKAKQAAEKASLAAANTKDIMSKRKAGGAATAKAKGGGKDGAYTYTGDDVSTYTNILNQGGTVDNIEYAARGKDSYVDPAAYMAIYNDWIKNGGTPAGFLKQFPVKNVNPDSRDKLPEGLTAKK